VILQALTLLALFSVQAVVLAYSTGLVRPTPQ